VYSRKNKPYRPGELEVILSLPPTDQNIRNLSALLERSPEAIAIVYKHAFEHGPFASDAGIQAQKVIAAKNRIGIAIGRKQLKRARPSDR
jgi:hypothetical protein